MSKYFSGQRVKHLEYEIGIVTFVDDSSDCLIIDFSGRTIKLSIKDIEDNHLLYTLDDLNNSSGQLNISANLKSYEKESDLSDDDYLEFTGGYDLKSNYLIFDCETGELDSEEDEFDSNSIESYESKIIFRRIESGFYYTGSTETEPGHCPDEIKSKKSIPRAFYISIFPVTQRQYELIMGNKSNPSFIEGDYFPVVNVSYDDIRGGNDDNINWPVSRTAVGVGTFLDILRKKFDNNYCFDLPTEVQWEVACRADQSTTWGNGTNITDKSICENLNRIGRYKGNRNDGNGEGDKLAQVGSYLPNKLGIFDMHGNVYEWCLDWYNYDNSEQLQSGIYRVIRGGSYLSEAAECRSSFRSNADPSQKDKTLGFRLVINF